MTNMHLSDALISGSRAVDNEHHLQLGLLDAVRQAVVGERDADEVAELLDRFVDFTKLHFASEASLMRLYQYAHFEAHMREHDRTVEQLEAMRLDWRAGHAHLTLDRMDTLADWIEDHIATADRAFGRYLVRLGVGPG